MNPDAKRLERIVTWTALLLAVGVLLRRAPVPTVSALGVGAIAIGVSRYATVGILSGAVMLPLLVGIAAGHRGIDLGVCAFVVALTFWHSRDSIKRLRRGDERQIGGALRTASDEKTVGLWAPPAPHGFLGRSALPLGAILVIAAAIGLAVVVTVRLSS